MYRLNYSSLNLSQVEGILAKSKAPSGASPFCGRLSGKNLRIIFDKQPVEGPVLEYSFQSGTKLSLKENGSGAVSCDYGAYSLKDITLFSHMIPGTKRGYTVIVNWKTTVVTAFEMWFLDYEGKVIDTAKTFVPVDDVCKLDMFINREVQRQYYFGYFEERGKAPPESRDKMTLRLENSMIKWKEDRGKKWLTTYTSSYFSTFVELDTPDGGDVLTFVSDILQVDENTYIHCYGEVEYSGRLSVEVLDLFSMKKVGMTMGIGENDEFEHTLYTGAGRFMGRTAAFYEFNDRGDKHSDFAASRFDFGKKGTRYAYRPSIMTKRLTAEEVTAASKSPLIYSQQRAKERIMMSSHVLPDTDYCAGKTLTFAGDDDFCAELRFKTPTELEYRMKGESEWHGEIYRAAELDEDLVVLAFYRSGSNPPSHLVFALDFKNGCATCVSSKMGTKYDIHDPAPSYHFGIIVTEGLTPSRIYRHGFTDELLGHSFTQTYSDAMSSIHIYNAPHSYSWTILTSAEPGSPGFRAGGPVWSSPCEYIKLRDGVYILNWVEQKWSGHMDTLCRNLKTGRDCGFAYGISHDGKEIHLDKMGSMSRWAGQVDLRGVYSLRSYNVLS